MRISVANFLKSFRANLKIFQSQFTTFQKFSEPIFFPGEPQFSSTQSCERERRKIFYISELLFVCDSIVCYFLFSTFSFFFSSFFFFLFFFLFFFFSLSLTLTALFFVRTALFFGPHRTIFWSLPHYFPGNLVPKVPKLFPCVGVSDVPKHDIACTENGDV